MLGPLGASSTPVLITATMPTMMLLIMHDTTKKNPVKVCWAKEEISSALLIISQRSPHYSQIIVKIPSKMNGGKKSLPQAEVMTSCLHSFIVECFSKLLKWPWMKLNHQSPGNVENRQISFATILVHYTIQARRNIWGQWGFFPT